MRLSINLLSLLFIGTASALSTTVSSSVFAGLQSTPLLRASDAEPVFLTSQWRQNTPFGVADEKAVCTFLRHFG